MGFTPLYTTENCKPAYQLRWSLACFLRSSFFLPSAFQEQVSALAEPHGVRILEVVQSSDVKFQVLLSSLPNLPPSKIVKLFKGSAQHLLRIECVAKLSRNFRLVSTGSANLTAVENYVSGQLEHHPLASPFSMERMRPFSQSFDGVDLSQPIQSSHGQYVLGLHLVFVHAQRWRTVNEDFHQKTQAAILATAKKKQHRISRISILPDHTHITLGFGYQECPRDIALSYMNNIAFKHEMQPFLMHSYYVGTIGPYNMSAIRQYLRVEEAAVAG